MLSIRINGENLKYFQTARVIRSIDNVCGGFDFTSTTSADNVFPIAPGAAVEILADDMTILTGFVDGLTESHSKDNHDVSVHGRDILQDLVDSTISGAVEFSPGINLVDIIKNVLSVLGINVKIINNAGTIENFTEEEKESQEIGQNAFDFIESFSRKRQVLINSDFNGNLVLTRGYTGKAQAKLQHSKALQGNNIISAYYRDTISDRYYKYSVHSQLDPFFSSDPPDEIVAPLGYAINKDIRKTRVLEFSAEESSDAPICKKRAEWEANIRRARAFEYSCEVSDHSINGIVFDINKLFLIDDSFSRISGEFLCKSVEYSYDMHMGSKTTLVFTTKDAYTLQSEQDQREAARAKDEQPY